jgi:quinol monooxygenase YgiN
MIKGSLMRISFIRIGLTSTFAVALCLTGLGAAATAQSQQPAASSAATAPVATTFVVRFKVKPGKNADFEKAMAKMQAALVSAEPGNVFYDLYLPAPDSQTYVLIEHYRNADAVAAHGKDPNTKQMVADINDLLDASGGQAISAERLTLVSGKPARP